MLCFKVLKTGLFLYIVVCFDFYCSALVEFFWVWRLQSSNFVRGPMSSAPLAKFLILHENPRVASRQAWSQKKTLDANFTIRNAVRAEAIT